MEAAVVEAVGLVSGTIGMVQYATGILKNRKVKLVAEQREKVKKLLIEIRNTSMEIEARSRNPDSKSTDFRMPAQVLLGYGRELNTIMSEIDPDRWMSTIVLLKSKSVRKAPSKKKAAIWAAQAISPERSRTSANRRYKRPELPPLERSLRELDKKTEHLLKLLDQK